MTKPKAYPNYWRRQEEREKRDRQAKALKILGWFVAAVIASFVFLVTANVMGLQSAVIFYGVMIAISCGILLAAKWIND